MRKRPGFLRGVSFSFMITPDHTQFKLTGETIDKLAWETVPQPPYSPDFALSDFHLFSPFKEGLRGTKFYDNDEVKENVLKWL